MNILNILLIVIIIALSGYCISQKLHQQGTDNGIQTYERLKIHVSNNDIMQYIRETAENFKPLMESKSIHFSIKCTPESMMGWIDIDIIDKIILLLLSDMVKNSNPDGKITMEAYTNKNYDHIIIRINDNAVELPNAGIIMVQQLTTMHRGTLQKEYYKQHGNMILLVFPISKRQFQEEHDEETAPDEETKPSAFHIPNNITLNIPKIELPAGYFTGKEPLGNLIQQAYNSTDQKFLQQAINCVKEHIDDSEYDREQFAADMGASASTLYNKLRALTGMNVTTFIRDIRIKTACQLAKDNPDLRVSDIAYRVGFRDPKYFATTFRKVTGMQPKEYINQLRIKN
jgi:AraC-like DNA-binding protein